VLREPLDNEFFEGKRSAELPFVINDEVRVISGIHAGRTGWVVALVRSSESAQYQVEFGDGTDELFPAGALTLKSN